MSGKLYCQYNAQNLNWWSVKCQIFPLLFWEAAVAMNGAVGACQLFQLLFWEAAKSHWLHLLDFSPLCVFQCEWCCWCLPVVSIAVLRIAGKEDGAPVSSVTDYMEGEEIPSFRVEQWSINKKKWQIWIRVLLKAACPIIWRGNTSLSSRTMKN